MTRFTGTQYEGKARKELQEWDIFSVGLQPDASPDLVIPKYNIGIEVKSTRLNKFYPSKNHEQYEYLKNKFSEDWPGYSASKSILSIIFRPLSYPFSNTGRFPSHQEKKSHRIPGNQYHIDMRLKRLCFHHGWSLEVR